VRELSLHLLDLAENSAAAGATRVEINVVENFDIDELKLAIIDNGRGMDSDTVKRVIDPFVTSRLTRKVGLGIPLLKESAEACNGSLEIFSMPGKGTTVTTTFQNSHIDRMPIGDISGTFLTLMVGHPDINWIFKYSIIPENSTDPLCFEFDDSPIKEVLGGIALTEPDVLCYLTNLLREGLSDIKLEQHLH
jgi:hypothetical protein